VASRGPAKRHNPQERVPRRIKRYKKLPSSLARSLMFTESQSDTERKCNGWRNPFLAANIVESGRCDHQQVDGRHHYQLEPWARRGSTAIPKRLWAGSALFCTAPRFRDVGDSGGCSAGGASTITLIIVRMTKDVDEYSLTVSTRDVRQILPAIRGRQTSRRSASGGGGLREAEERFRMGAQRNLSGWR